MTLDLFMWLVTLASVVGTFANTRKLRWSFAVWFATNIAWAAYDAWLGAWPQCALFCVYAALAVYGWIHWGRRKTGPVRVRAAICLWCGKAIEHPETDDDAATVAAVRAMKLHDYECPENPLVKIAELLGLENRQLRRLLAETESRRPWTREEAAERPCPYPPEPEEEVKR
jgi:hypothetical protein